MLDAARANHENHEARFMIRGLGRRPPWSDHAARDGRIPAVAGGRLLCHLSRRLPMKWQTPTATDYRFGFEITMYVAAR
jgi:coenzyme PQQ precursor peptide PqqA